MSLEYECLFCREKLLECDEDHFLALDKKGNEIAIYVFFCTECKETFHCNGAEVEHV